MQSTLDKPSPRTARRFHDDGGFTLIELLVVIVIIGVLSTVVIFSVQGINERGQDAACKADRNTLKVAEEAAFAKDGVYVTEDGLVSGGFIEAPSTNYNVAAVGSTPIAQDYAITVQNSKCTL